MLLGGGWRRADGVQKFNSGGKPGSVRPALVMRTNSAFFCKVGISFDPV